MAQSACRTQPGGTNQPPSTGTLPSLAPRTRPGGTNQPPSTGALPPLAPSGDDLTREELRELSDAAKAANITEPALLRELRVIGDRLKEMRAAGDPNTPDLKTCAVNLARVRGEEARRGVGV